MWHEVHWNRHMECWALYVGTPDGYRIDALYYHKWTAKIIAKIRGYRFCK